MPCLRRADGRGEQILNGAPVCLAQAKRLNTSMSSELVVTRTTPDPLDAVCARLPEISQKHKFGVLGTHNLREKMASKGVTFDRECRVFEVCNPHQAKDVLTRSMEVATALPCRIAVYEEAGRTVLATIKPTALLTLFDAPGAEGTAGQVEAALLQIMEEAALARASGPGV